ncbi:MAG: response regulator [Myxococcota bacterium]
MSRGLVLVVEDHQLNRQLIAEVLGQADFEVLEAGTEQEALARVQDATPDLVLMDIELPGGDGVHALHELRRIPRLADVPVLAVTAYAMRGDRERLLAQGFDGYISKPIDTRTFPGWLDRWLPREEDEAAEEQ